MPKKLLVSDVTGLPVATDSMTKNELRQLCLDYFELQLSPEEKRTAFSGTLTAN